MTERQAKAIHMLGIGARRAAVLRMAVHNARVAEETERILSVWDDWPKVGTMNVMNLITRKSFANQMTCDYWNRYIQLGGKMRA